jgi:(1->4)-alpha-D-glucan 1-alpha-D-glucosylmutase
MSPTSQRRRASLLRVPVSTYRLQLNAQQTFAQAAEVTAYLHSLGVTDLYVSPSFTAAPGSQHGYDICDHRHINPELGGESGFAALAETLRGLGMGLLLDFVPNHMGADPMANPWWRDVLENGPSSPYARFFDIDWQPIKPELRNKVLLPVLGDQYGSVLDRGELRVELASGAFSLAYFERRFPLNPRRMVPALHRHLDGLKASLGADSPLLREFLSITTALHNLPAYTETDAARIEERQREKEVARERLERLVRESPAIAAYLDRSLRELNGQPGEPASFDHLHSLLEEQAYRLAYWRTALHEINYRRFFDINELVGVRVEDEKVFAEVHGGLLPLVAQGQVTGLRLDHLDGLYDPRGYLARLDESLRAACGSSLYVLAEKILSGGETLREDFRLDGTTGYDFLNEVNGLFVDGRAALPLKRLHLRFTGRTRTLPEVIYRSKRLIAASALASELTVLANALNHLSEQDRHSRDFTLISLQDALRDVVACFPVYRTYVGDEGATGKDAEVIETAITEARRRNPATESSVFDFVRTILLSRPQGNTPVPAAQRALALKLQQYTGPLQAKGLEDTTFYRYNVLVSLNEVGGDPQRFGTSVRAFHNANLHRARRWPFTMLATSTHDTKRGEDARCRLDVLSEIPSEWAHAVAAWHELNTAACTRVSGESAPDAGDEYLFYQALLGAWPMEHLGGEPPPAFVARMQAYMRKALREAKLHTSWINVNEPYEKATERFIETVLDPVSGKRFIAQLAPLCETLAFCGMLNSLAQLMLKLASPGVPDFYQGCEIWNLSLADPDNRRPVDFPALAAALALIDAALDDATPSARRRELATRWLQTWKDGTIKLLLTAAGLRLRRRHADLFLEGDYLPLEVEGPAAKHVVALARQLGEDQVVAVVPRLCHALGGSAQRFPLGAEVWRDTRVCLPGAEVSRVYRDALTGKTLASLPVGGRPLLGVGDVLADLPIALLTSDSQRT